MTVKAKEGETPSNVADPVSGDAAPIEVITEEIKEAKEWQGDLAQLAEQLRKEMKDATEAEAKALRSELAATERKLSEASATISTLRAELAEAKKASPSKQEQSTPVKSQEKHQKSDGGVDPKEAEESKTTAQRKRNRGSWI